MVDARGGCRSIILGVSIFSRENFGFLDSFERINAFFLATELQCHRIVAGFSFFFVLVATEFRKMLPSQMPQMKTDIFTSFLPCHLLLNYSFQFAAEHWLLWLLLLFRWCILKFRAGLLRCSMFDIFTRFGRDDVCFVVLSWLFGPHATDDTIIIITICQFEEEEKREIKAFCAANETSNLS